MNLLLEKLIEEYLILGLDISILRETEYPCYLLQYALNKGINLEYIPNEPLELTRIVLKQLFGNICQIDKFRLCYAHQLICDNIEPNPLFNPNFDPNQLQELKICLRSGLDVSYFKDAIFDSSQMQKIREGLEKGLDVSVYAKPDFNRDQMHVLYKGLLQGLDPTPYANPIYTSGQMEELRHGLSLNLDIALYSNEKLSVGQMRLIRECLEQDIYIKQFSNPYIPASLLRFISRQLYRRKKSTSK